jgi:hypothetical protein
LRRELPRDAYPVGDATHRGVLDQRVERNVHVQHAFELLVQDGRAKRVTAQQEKILRRVDRFASKNPSEHRGDLLLDIIQDTIGWAIARRRRSLGDQLGSARAQTLAIHLPVRRYGKRRDPKEAPRHLPLG